MRNGGITFKQLCHLLLHGLQARPPREFAGPGAKLQYIWYPYDVTIFKQQDQKQVDSTPKRREYLSTGPLMPYTRPDFHGAFLNFRLILKFGAYRRLGAWSKLSPALPLISQVEFFVHLGKTRRNNYTTWPPYILNKGQYKRNASQ